MRLRWLVLALALAYHVALLFRAIVEIVMPPVAYVEHGPLMCANGRVFVEWNGARATARCDLRPAPRAVVVRDEWTCDRPGSCRGVLVEYADGER